MRQIPISEAQVVARRIFRGGDVDLAGVGREWKLFGFAEYSIVYSAQGIDLIEEIFGRIGRRDEGSGGARLRFVGADGSGCPVERGGVSASVEFGLNGRREEYEKFVEMVFTDDVGRIAQFRYELSRGCWVLGEDDCVLVGDMDFEYVGIFARGDIFCYLEEIPFTISFDEMETDWARNSGGNRLIMEYIDSIKSIYMR